VGLGRVEQQWIECWFWIKRALVNEELVVSFFLDIELMICCGNIKETDYQII